MEKYKYTTIFSSFLKPLVSEEKDKYLSIASLMDVGEFIPDIDSESNYDLLPVAFNAFVANRVNKNGDVIDTSTAVEIHNNFINKPINIEHNRDRIVGVILAAGFSEFGTDKPITEEEAKAMNGPFNVTLGGVIWKVANSALAELIEDSNDPTSEFYQKISASWELGFSDYKLALVDGPEKNLEDASVVEDDELIAELEGNLKSLGGTGVTDDGKAIYRYVVGSVVPLGIGLTESPAADVQGVAVKSLDKSDKTDNNNTDNKNSSSQTEQINVKKDIKTMKIESLKDITEESLKSVSASAVSDFIEEELKKASEDYSSKLAEKDEALSELQTKNASQEEDLKKLSEELESVKSSLTDLEEQKLAKEAEERFSDRMSSMDDKYELTDEDREVIAADIKDLDKDQFDSYLSKMSVLLRHKDKEELAAKAEEVKVEETKAEEVKVEEAKTEEIEATNETESEEIVEEVLEEAQADTQEIPTSSEAQEPTLHDKYKAAFDVEQFEIKAKY
jgi:hypothetical protein